VKTHGKEGDTAKVHQPLVTLELEASAVAASPEAITQVAEPPAPRAPERAQASSNGDGAKVLATPVTRRMAREHGLNLSQIAGSGPQGRVTKADVVAAIGGEGAVATGRVASSIRALEGPPVPVMPIVPARGDQRIPLKGLRRKIADKMVRSKHSAPHFTFVEEMDASELVAVRKRLNDALAESGDRQKISFLPFICKGLVAAFKKYPSLNANFDEATQELVVRGAYNIGIAAATDEGLTVPVVKDVDRLSIHQLSAEIVRLGTAARERRLKLDELTGGSFTITSLGQLGGLLATPIINHPEVAILGVHKMRKRPVVKDDQVVVREMMYLSLSFDHRVIDGLVGAEFTYALIRYLEHPELLFLEMT
jgi:pyruvate dehydrogenase E2 component (dihydrolipoamide acetyltransferase)